MKTPFRRQHTLAFALVVTVALATARPAFAEPIKSAGAYSEAKAESSASAVKDSPRTLVYEVKRWVKSKYHELKALWTGEPAAQPAVAIAKRGTPQLHPQAAPAQALSLAAPPSAQPIERTLRAPSSANTEETALTEQPGLKRTSTGVASYDISTSPRIPRLKIDKEDSVSASSYALDRGMQKILNERVVHALQSPELMANEEIKKLTVLRTARAGEPQSIKDARYALKGKVSREAFDRIVLHLAPEAKLNLEKFVPLTPEESRFLSGLLLFQKGDQCPTVIGMFYKLSKSKGWEAESNYYLSMCSKQLGLGTDFYERARRVLETQDLYYSKKIMAEFGTDVPYEINEEFGASLLKAAQSPKILEGLDAKILSNISYILADYSVSTERFKTALTWAPKVTPDHPKYLQAQFLLALAEYQAGSKENAIKIEDKIVGDKTTDKARMEFQALVALNAGRMHFQEQNFKAAHDNFLKVYKDHPLWLTSLTELGWAQLMDGDFEGAIGNMYSIQSPFFRAVYKPESFVIRTIGYLNLCQYGDAYRTLSVLEHDYRPYLEKMSGYLEHAKSKPAYYQTVKSFFSAPKNATEIDGLPMSVVREMARHRDFINLQKALNRQIDERPNYSRIDNAVELKLKAAQTAVNNTRQYNQGLRAKLASSLAKHDLQMRQQLQADLDAGLNKLNDQFFDVDLYSDAKASMDEYRKEVIGGADTRIANMRGSIERVLANRLLRMKVDLARVLDNNELLRYEVFAGSGENIRYQVAGGDVAHRVPANVLPKSKALHWDFDGEYWEDEIGNYRSSLKNNCPDKRSTASLDGGVK